MDNLQTVIHRNNFNLLRLIFSIFVLITHAYVLSGNTEKEPLSVLTHGQINFSYIGLRGFFIISGFLIFQSFQRSTSAFDFLWKRILRILPGLFTISVVTIFFVCPLISKLSIGQYFSESKTYLAFLESIDPLFLKNNHPSVSGVFEENIHTSDINGSIWTISYEFLFYIGFVFFFTIKKKKSIQTFVLASSILFLIFIKYRYLDPWFIYDVYILNTKFLVKALTDFLLFFLSGALFSILKFEKLAKRYFKLIAGCLLPIIVFLLFFNYFSSYFLFLLIPFILAIGLLNIGKLDFTQKIGDISYGIYLSSFFLQQFFISTYNLNSFSLLWVSLVFSILYGLLSWNFIEKPSLLLKKRKLNY